MADARDMGPDPVPAGAHRTAPVPSRVAEGLTTVTTGAASPGASSWSADGRRSRLAALVSFGVLVGVLGVLAAVGPPNDDWAAALAVLAVVGFNLYATVYVVMTWRVLAPVDSAGFAARMAMRSRMRKPGMRRLMPWGDGPSFAISASVMAFTIVLVVPHIDAIRLDDWVLVPASIITLLACWGMSVVSYAVHYAQYDLAKPALDFPGRRTEAFQDYVYFAIGVATTLGATDVTVTEPGMRRIVSFNVVVAFLFNSAVVALLASILIR